MRLSGQNLHAGMSGDEVAELHSELTRLGFTIPEGEQRDQTFGVGTAQAVTAFRTAHGLAGPAVVDRRTAAALTHAVAALSPNGPTPVPVPVPGPDPGTEPAPDGSAGITGRVYLEYGVPAADLRLRAYRRGFGGTAARLGEETRTGPDGSYRIRFDADGAPVNLELRAVQTRGNRVSEVALTDTVFAVAQGDVLNVVAPTSVRPLGSEYGRLLADVERHLQGRRLGEAKETDEQADLTLLQESTGWDARLVALAASAEHVAAETGVTPTAAYAMLRAGLPDDPVGLAGVSANAVTRALGQGADGGGGRPRQDRARRRRRRVHLVRRCHATRRGRPGGLVEPGRDAGCRGPVRRRRRPLRRDRRGQRAARWRPGAVVAAGEGRGATGRRAATNRQARLPHAEQRNADQRISSRSCPTTISARRWWPASSTARRRGSRGSPTPPAGTATRWPRSCRRRSTARPPRRGSAPTPRTWPARCG